MAHIRGLAKVFGAASAVRWLDLAAAAASFQTPTVHTNHTILVIRTAKMVVNHTEEYNGVHLHVQRALGVQVKAIHVWVLVWRFPHKVIAVSLTRLHR